MLFDREGNLQGKAQQHYPPYTQPQPGYCVHDADLYWRSVQQACAALWQQGFLPAQVAAISVTAQRGSLVPLDGDGKPLMPAWLWMDQRLAERLPRMNMLWRLGFTLRGVTQAVQGFRRKAISNWLHSHDPVLHDKVHKWLFLSGYLNFKLTGTYADSRAAQVGYVPFDYATQRWANRLSWKWSALSMRREQMPRLVNSGEVLGELSESSATLLGLPVGLPVVASGADKACEVLGSGGITPDVACLSFGTSASVNVCHPQYREAIRHMPAYPSILSPQFCYEVMLNRGFWMVSWFKEQFGLAETLRADDADMPVEALFDELVDKVPPGAMGLMLQPYWGAGIREPGPEAKGAIIGFGDIHKREHLYRAILEGINFGLKEGLDKIQQRCKVKPTLLRISGGGSQSDAAMQIAADIFGLPAERPHTNETSGLGAAIASAAALGWYADMQQAAIAMTRVGKRFEPNMLNHRQYQRLYREVYVQMYPKLQPLYQKIREITGYPE